MNVVVLKGNLTRDPEVRTVGSGDRETQVANFTVAVNRHFKRADGTKDKETTYVDCEVWDSAANHLGEFCKKGDPILVQGALKLDSWESEGQKKSRLKVRVNNFDRLYRSPGFYEGSEEATTVDADETVDAELDENVESVGAGEDIPF